MKNNRGIPIQYPYGDKLVCPVCGKRLYHHQVENRRWIIGWHCDRDEKSCRKYIVRDKVLDRAVLEAVNSLNSRKLEEDGYPSLAKFRKEHLKVRSVHYWWLDEFVDRITFGQGHTLTVHWKDGQDSKHGFETTVQMIVNYNTTDPVLLAQQVENEAWQAQRKGKSGRDVKMGED